MVLKIFFQLGALIKTALWVKAREANVFDRNLRKLEKKSCFNLKRLKVRKKQKSRNLENQFLQKNCKARSYYIKYCFAFSNTIVSVVWLNSLFSADQTPSHRPLLSRSNSEHSLSVLPFMAHLMSSYKTSRLAIFFRSFYSGFNNNIRVQSTIKFIVRYVNLVVVEHYKPAFRLFTSKIRYKSKLCTL